MLRAIEQYATDAEVTIADGNPDLLKSENVKLNTENSTLSTIHYQLGAKHLSDLDQFDCIIASPGVRPSSELEAVQEKVTTPTAFFFAEAQAKGSTIIGVTGSKGKSTVSSLIYEILRTAGKDVYLCGNIGIPSLGILEHAKEDTIFVHELSSAQLARMQESPDIAVITSLFPEHLDYHGSMEAYTQAKANICRFQKSGQIAFIEKSLTELANLCSAEVKHFSREDAPLTIKETKLKGEHNLANIAAAWLTCKELGADESTARSAIAAFKGLRHRLEEVGVFGGILWIDDAISTTPESAIAALNTYPETQTIILGGQDRGNDFSELGKRIALSSVQTVILFPESGTRIRSAIEQAHAEVSYVDAHSMEEAIHIAKEKTPENGIVLLSTASPSYNMFKNFEEKGDIFQELVRKI